VPQAGKVPVDASALKERIDLLELIGRDTRLKRVASTRGGEYAGACPFCGGRDRLRVQPERRRWWCRGCLGGERWQDAIAYVQRRDGIADFLGACRQLGASPGEQGLGVVDKPTASIVAATRPDHILLAADLEPSTPWCDRGLCFVGECQRTLWSPIGERARAYLHSRGLRDRTLQTWQLGFQAEYGRYEPAAEWGFPGEAVYVPRGIVLPWFVGAELRHIQVRTSPHDRQERYLSVRGGHPWLFGAATLVPRAPAILLEGALDTVLVWQDAGDLLGTASLGSCRKLPSRSALDVLGQCLPLFGAYDADDEGEAGASRLRQILSELVRVRPPTGKDPTRFRRAGGSVRAWVEALLARTRDDRVAGRNAPG
jgi:hypothetical protein